MNLAEIRKKAGAVKKEEVAVVPLVDASAATAIADDSDYLNSCVTFESYSEPEVAAAPLEDQQVSAESCAEAPEEVEPVAEIEVQVAVQPAFDEVPVIDDVPVRPVDRSDARLVAAAPVKGTKPAVIDVIVAGREASVDSEDVLAANVVDSSMSIAEYLCFRVAAEEYAISIMSIKEIIKPREVTEVPRVPLFIQGVISLRGLIIPVMDMRCRLALPVGSGTGRERIIVVRMDAGFCGILVDEVVQVARIARKDIEDPPAILDGIDKAFVKGLGHHDGRMIILLDLEAILDAGMH